MNDVYCGWRPFPQFKPDDGELVICHHYWWKDRYGEPMIYRENVKMFERGNFAGMIEEKCVDFWMRIPSIPKGVETDVFKLKWELVQEKYPEYVFRKRLVCGKVSLHGKPTGRSGNEDAG